MLAVVYLAEKKVEQKAALTVVGMVVLSAENWVDGMVDLMAER